MRWRLLILLGLLVAALGGTFTCESKDDHTKIHINSP